MKPLRLAFESVEELADAASWYESKRPGLAAKFLDEFERTLLAIRSRPASYPRLRDTSLDLDIRRALLSRFPYAVLFLELNEEIRVVAVAHVKRHPDYWLNRVQP